MTQKLLPIYGRDLAGEHLADGAVPFYRFVKIGSSAREVTLATSLASIMGVSIPDEMMMDYTMSTGAQSVRTGWRDGEPASIYAHGLVYLEIGGSINQGDYVVSDASGKAVAYTAPTISSSFIQSELQSAFDNLQKIGGQARETIVYNGGATPQYILIDLDKR